jgi:poly(hydroxyalkanoate) depolymerase family esterase
MMNIATDNWPFFGWNPWAFTQESTGGPDIAPASRGEFIGGVFHSGAQSLRYKLYIPSSRGDGRIPLVVMLHGCGQDADDFARGTRMNELAELANCMVLYPEQSMQVSWNRCWTWYDQGHHERDKGEPALIAGLTQALINEHAIDRSRVAVAGLSSGGAMAVILGRTYPDVYKAVGCHSGLAHGSATDSFSALTVMRDGADINLSLDAHALTPVPTIVFHGDVDYTVDQKNSAEVVRQAIECYTSQAPGESVSTAMCEHKGEASGRSFTRCTHRSAAGDVVAELWTVHGTGHAWSGGDICASYTEPRGPDASKEMLRFFMQRPGAEAAAS